MDKWQFWPVSCEGIHAAGLWKGFCPGFKEKKKTNREKVITFSLSLEIVKTGCDGWSCSRHVAISGYLPWGPTQHPEKGRLEWWKEHGYVTKLTDARTVSPWAFDYVRYFPYVSTECDAGTLAKWNYIRWSTHSTFSSAAIWGISAIITFVICVWSSQLCDLPNNPWVKRLMKATGLCNPFQVFKKSQKFSTSKHVTWPIARVWMESTQSKEVQLFELRLLTTKS